MAYQMTVPKVRSIIDDSLTDADGAFVSGRAVTALLHVSPNGNNGDGSTWAKAYTKIQTALDEASTDTDDATLILISPHTTYYDIDTTGDPAWAANVMLVGTHRLWTVIRNTHASATSILKFTGKACIRDLAFLQTGTLNGVIFTKSGYLILSCGFSSSGLSGAATSIYIDGTAGTVIGGTLDNVEIRGHKTRTKGLYLNTATVNEISNTNIHTCLTGVQIANAASDENIFKDVDIGDCTLGLDLDAGNVQRFQGITFHDNTTNVDDVVGDHTWVDIHGAFPIKIEPDNLTGVSVTTGSAGNYGTDTEIRAAATSTVPFRIVGVNFDTATSEWYQVRFSDDSGSTWYDVIQLDANKREGVAAPSGTEFIFNKGTRISCSARDVSGGDIIKVWLEIQEI